mgnify:CR=1 FL=1|tara:strand:+ start:822 stop:1247 length:426 start_codon:yes stop_codon:yes gene_type:complete
MIDALQGKRTLLLAPQAMTNSATVTANVDCDRADYATIEIALASEINTNAVGPTISLLQSDDTVVTNFATVTADRSSEAFVTAKTVVYQVDLRGKKRYLRLSVTTATATNDDVTVSAVANLTRNRESPLGTTGQGDAVVIV